MKHLTPTRRLNTARGFVSVIIMLFLATVVLFILGKSLTMSGSKSLESQEQFDGVAALALAESGREVALATITTAFNQDDTTFGSNCASFASSSPVALGRGSFQFVPSSTPTTTDLCPIRVQGSVNKAKRTVETQINFNSQIGTGGYGTAPTMTLRNPYSVPAAAVFNLAWRRLGSTGHNPPGGQAEASTCTLPSCGEQWNLESSSGIPSVGSLGTALSVAANSSVQVAQTIDSPRNYTEVGLILGGLSATPVLKGSYSDDKETANTANNTITYGTTPSGEPSAGPQWCAAADTLVFGVSGRGDDDPSARYVRVLFNTSGAPAQPMPLTYVAHYPNTDGSSPNTFGDVFSEVWWTYNPYIRMTGGSSAGTTTVTVTSTTGLQPDTYIQVYSGAGAFPAYTRVKQVTSATTFTIDQKIPVITATPPAPGTPLAYTYTELAPMVNLSNAVICGGICALFNTPASNAAKTTQFSLERANSATQQWAGGFACFSGVDKTKVRYVSNSSLRLQLWHEVLAGE